MVAESGRTTMLTHPAAIFKTEDWERRNGFYAGNSVKAVPARQEQTGG